MTKSLEHIKDIYPAGSIQLAYFNFSIKIPHLFQAFTFGFSLELQIKRILKEVNFFLYLSKCPIVITLPL